MSDAVIASSVAAESVLGPSNKLEVRKPVECCEALDMLSHGVRHSEIVAKTGLTYRNISDLKLRHQGAIDNRRERAAWEAEELADSYRDVMREKVKQILENPDLLAKLNPKDAALTYAILTDKARDLRGEATAVIEHRKGVSLEDARKAIEAAQKKIQGEAIDV